MTFPMPTDTAHVRLRTRMYRFLSIDLGEGVETSTLKVAGAFVVPWVILCWLVGVPLLDLPFIYVLPPTFLTFRACTRDAGGRVRLRGWVDRFDARRAQRPIVDADTAPTAPLAPITCDVAFSELSEDELRRRAANRKDRHAQAA